MPRKLLLVAVMTFLPGVVRAHTLSTSYASFTVTGEVVKYSATAASHDLLGPMPQLDRDADGDLSAEELHAGRRAVASYFRARIQVHDGEVACSPSDPSVEIPAGTREVHVAMDFQCPAPPTAPSLRAMVFDEPGSKHRVSTSVTLLDGTSRAAMLSIDAPVFRPVEGGLAAQLGHFLLQGILHFATGYDHILFLAAVLVAADRLGRLALIVTSFTIGHSITLILATLNVVALPSRWVESAIALSIAYVAVENVAVEEINWRWAVTFAFGLVHGFGFASVLRQAGLPTEALVPSLLMFNVGVELGQLVAVGAMFPLLLLIRRSQHHRLAIACGSALIGACGTYWFVERAFGAGLGS